MLYPEDFKKKVKEVYPTYEVLHQKLDEGAEYVGILLQNGIIPFLPSRILEATSLEELKKEAESTLVKMTLYEEWERLYKEEWEKRRKEWG